MVWSALVMMVAVLLFVATIGCAYAGFILAIMPLEQSCAVRVGGILLVLLSIPLGTAMFLAVDKSLSLQSAAIREKYNRESPERDAGRR